MKKLLAYVLVVGGIHFLIVFLCVTKQTDFKGTLWKNCFISNFLWNVVKNPLLIDSIRGCLF